MRLALWILGCLGLLLAMGSARAEVSAGVVSDYRYRGISLSDGRPALQGGIVWDRDDGWHAGVFGATTRIASEDGVQLVSYLGRARRLDSGRSWEAGVQYVVFSRHRGEDYRELYAGLASDRWGLRLSVQPKALGRYGPAAYGEANATLPLGARLQLLAHVGAGWRGGRLEHGVDRIYYDGRAGLGTALGAYHLHALWVTTRGRGGYLADDLPHDAGADGLVVGVTRFW